MTADITEEGRGEDRPATTGAIQDYAKAIYALEQRAEGAVSTNALAERLGVTAGSASAMIKRLDGLGLVSRIPYRGVRLTDEGRRVALDVLRRHRLLERFLTDELDVPWDQVHAEAEVLEHVVSEHLAERIAAKLGHPTHDPHGDPIPTVDGDVDTVNTRALADLQPGECGIVSRVSDSNAEMLRYLAERGIRPGSQVEVRAREPFDGPLTVSLGGREHVLGGVLARAVRVAPSRDAA